MAIKPKNAEIITKVIVLFLLILIAGAFYLYRYINHSQQMKLLKVVNNLGELQTQITNERSGGKRFVKSDWDLKPYATDATRLQMLNPNGVIMVQLNMRVHGMGERWIFMVPAIRVENEKYEHLDMSKDDYDMVKPMLWICGVPHEGGVDKELLPPHCRMTFAPTLQAIPN